MRRRPVLALLLGSLLSPLSSGLTAVASAPDAVPFQRRVAAEEAIQRAYFSHQLGAREPFEQAVPRDVIENRVRTYLAQSKMLEQYWRTPITLRMLQAEKVRIEARSMFRDRLQEIYDALGRDPLLIRECFVRPRLVARMISSFYDQDERIHGDAWREIHQIRDGLEDGTIDGHAPHPRRRVVRLRTAGASEGAAATPRQPVLAREGLPVGTEVTAEEMERWKDRLARGPRGIGAISTRGGSFVLPALLEQGTDELRIAWFIVPKKPWETWWSEASDSLGADALPVPADPLTDGHPEPVLPAAPCPPGAWDNRSLDDPPLMRINHSTVWTGTKMIVWGGGEFGSDRWNTGNIYDPLTDTWASVSLVGAPSPRGDHIAVWTGSEMIVWGGSDGSQVLGTGGRYDPLTDTWAPMSAEGAPSARERSKAVWTGSEVLLWGGFGSFALPSGGRYDPSTDTWAPISLTLRPDSTTGHTAVWTGTYMIVWGGVTSGGGHTNSGRRYDPVTDQWSNIASPGLDARGDHTAVWTGTRMILWGGKIASIAYGDGSSYDPATNSWTPLSAVNAPTPRAVHTAVWTGSEMIVWGGSVGMCCTVFDTGGRYDPAADSWLPTSTENSPRRRDKHGAVWTGDRMIVWGGTDRGTVMNTGGRYDPETDSWTPTSLGAPLEGRSDHTAVWTGTEMIVWGGGLPFQNGARYDPLVDTWSAMTTIGAPSARTRHSAVWTGSEMIVWGGAESSGYETDTGARYAPLVDTWSTISPVSAPSARGSHTAVWTGDRMVVWGGGEPAFGPPVATGGVYDPETDAWAHTAVAGAPSARRDHTSVWTGESMIVWGGHLDYVQVTDTGSSYDPVTNSWTPLAIDGAPAARAVHTATWIGDSMIVWGGSYLDTGGRYFPDTDTWISTSVTGAPSPRQDHTAIWTGTELLVWGGASPAMDTGGRYAPQTDAWEPTPAEGAPLLRAGHTAIWSGASMIVWGGNSAGSSHRNSGGIYIPSDSDADLDGVSACDGDCDDSDPTSFPGSPEICDGRDNDCDGTVPAEELDVDGDGFAICAGDCDPVDPSTHPEAPETNDGQDNQCPGETGFGLVDEISGTAGFETPDSTTVYSWPAQPGATLYQGARSTAPDFASCGVATTSLAILEDSTVPAVGAVFYYLVRALSPFPGSWGSDSSGNERVLGCAP